MAERGFASDYLAVVREAANAARADVGWVVIWLIGSTLIFAAVELWLEETLSMTLTMIMGLVQTYVQLALLFRALHRAGLTSKSYNPLQPTSRRFPATVWQSCVWAFGVGVGFLLLVIPGIIFMARWFVCLPVLAAEDETVANSFRRSWELTRGSEGLMICLTLTDLTIFAAGIGAELLLYPEFDYPSFPLALALNALFGLTALAFVYLQFAAYQMLRMRAARE